LSALDEALAIADWEGLSMLLVLVFVIREFEEIAFREYFMSIDQLCEFIIDKHS
jgi:hypothetical protein